MPTKNEFAETEHTTIKMDRFAQLQTICVCLLKTVAQHREQISLLVNVVSMIHKQTAKVKISNGRQMWIWNSTAETLLNKENMKCLSFRLQLEVWLGLFSNSSRAIVLFNHGNNGSESITVR